MKRYFVAAIALNMMSPSLALSNVDCSQFMASALFEECAEPLVQPPAGGGSTDFSGGEWERQNVEYPHYGVNVPKPWDENPDFWNEYFAGKYDLACGQTTFQGTAKCAVAWAEFTRFGYCYNLKAYESTGIQEYRTAMDDWVKNSHDLTNFVREYNVSEPSREFWACN